jgi:hypothetical protein
MLDFARIWQATNKIVCSKTLEIVSARKTRLEREFDPEAVRDLKAHVWFIFAITRRRDG